MPAYQILAAVDYEKALKELSGQKPIGPGPFIYAESYGTVRNGALETGVRPEGFAAAGAVLEAVQNTVVADTEGSYFSFQKRVPWDGTFVLASSFGEQLPPDLQKTGAPETIQAVNSDGTSINLLSAQVQQLVGAMAGMTPTTGATSSTGLSNPANGNQLYALGVWQ